MWLASRVYARSGAVDRRIVRLGLPIGIPAVVVGAMLTRWIPGGPLIIATDAMVLALGLRILLTRHRAAATDGDDRATLARILMVVGVVGFVSGLLGNSGGFLLAPLFMTALGLPIHRALGTSLVLAIGLAIPGTVVHAVLGHIDWSLTLAFGLASTPAAAFGARVAMREPGPADETGLRVRPHRRRRRPARARPLGAPAPGSLIRCSRPLGSRRPVTRGTGETPDSGHLRTHVGMAPSAGCA